MVYGGGENNHKPPCGVDRYQPRFAGPTSTDLVQNLGVVVLFVFLVCIPFF